MQNILLVAKEYALLEKASEIRPEHLANALPCLVAVDDALVKQIQRLLPLPTRPPIEVSQSLLIALEEWEVRLPLSRETKEILEKLADRANGLSRDDYLFVAADIDRPRSKRRRQRSSEQAALIQSNKKRSTASLPDEHDSNANENTPVAPVINTAAEFRRLEQLKSELQASVVGQGPVLAQFISFMERRQLKPPQEGELSVLLLVGPAGTGKSFFVDQLQKSSLLSEIPVRVFNMAQFDSSNEGFGLTGLRKGFTDAHEGSLTRFALDNPRAIIVFDHLDRAHPAVQSQVADMLGRGIVEDAYLEREISLRNNLIFVTLRGPGAFFQSPQQLIKIEQAPGEARESFLTAVLDEANARKNLGRTGDGLSRSLFDTLKSVPALIFRPLPFEALAQIAEGHLANVSKQLEGHCGLKLTGDLTKLAWLYVASVAPEYELRRLTQRIDEDLITAGFQTIQSSLSAPGRLSTQEVKIDPELSILALMKQTGSEQIETFLSHLKRQRQQVKFRVSIDRGAEVCLKAKEVPAMVKISRTTDFDGPLALAAVVPDTRFEDIAGHDATKSRLKRLIHWMASPANNQILDVIPKGLILYGPPGTGKTMLARATAREAGLPFIPITGNDLLEEDNILRIFDLAREYAPSIVFIDELDAIPKRGTGGQKIDWIVNRLLTEIDGFGGSDDQRVLILAATNRIETLDSALVRSGRLDVHLHVGALDRTARRWFIEKLVSEIPTAADIELDDLVRATAGLTGADIAHIKREAAYHLVETAHQALDNATLMRLIETQRYGHALQGQRRSPQLQWEQAIHQSAKAVVANVLQPEKPLLKLTLLSREKQQAGPSYDTSNAGEITRPRLFNETVEALAGRAAQERWFGENGVDESSEPDLALATRYAKDAIERFAMDSDSEAPVHWSSLKDYGTSASVLRSIERWLMMAFAKAKETVELHANDIEKLAKALYEAEEMTGRDVAKVDREETNKDAPV